MLASTPAATTAWLFQGRRIRWVRILTRWAAEYVAGTWDFSQQQPVGTRVFAVSENAVLGINHANFKRMFFY